MTEIHRTSAVRVHQMRESYRSSCNSTPESYTMVNGSSSKSMNKNTYRSPLLQTVTDHLNLSSSASGRSITTIPTGQNTGWATGAANGPHQQLPSKMSSSTSEIQFDEKEIFNVSPTKRKIKWDERNAASSGRVAAGNIVSTANSNSLRKSKQGNSSYHHYHQQAQSPSPPTCQVTVVSPSATYGFRAAGNAHDLSFDNYEDSSHFSDTAMQVLRSGSCSGIGGIIANGNLIVTDGGGASSSTNSLVQQHQQQQHIITSTESHSTSYVPFPNYHLAQERVLRQSNQKQQQQQHHHQNNHGSLRRSKGRSNQSLCSCDAGADTEINPDPVRPLYQYSLESRAKGQHTYTCEQNAQILMRLERERNCKLSLNPTASDYSREGNGGTERDALGIPDPQSETCSLSDNNAIPPIPPPPVLSMARKSIHQRNQYQKNRDQRSSSMKTPLCHVDILHDCTESAIEVGSLLDDCATTIIKCANVVGSEILAAATHNSSNKASTAAMATTATDAKSDVCHENRRMDFCNSKSIGSNDQQQLCIRDDIFIPNSKKSDPSLCFLHGGGFGGPYPFAASPNYKTNQQNRNNLNFGKYNTIGPSSNYAKQLATYQYHRHHQNEQQKQVDERCRCLSQSLCNFSTKVGGATSKKSHHNQHPCTNGEMNIYPMDDMYHIDNFSHWYPNGSPGISRSIGNLLYVDSSGRCGSEGKLNNGNIAYQHHHHPPYTHFQTTTPANVFSSSSSSFSFGGTTNLINNSFTTLASSSSGLKEKLHEHHHGGVKQSNHQQKHQHLHSSTMSIMPWKHRQCPSRGSSSSGTNSLRFDAAKHWLAVSSILLIIGAASVAVPLALRVAASAPFEERLRVAAQLLDQVPLIDGHNDLPWNIRKFLHNKLNDFNFDEDLRNVMPWARSQWSHTDLQRLKKGRISAQFWAAYVPCEAQHRDAVQLTLEQIDVIKRLTERYSPQLTTCTSAADIIEAHRNHQLCSLTGVEGGHSLGGSLAVLRTLYAIGVRYMTLTSTCHTPWADSSYADAPTFNVKHGGLTIFGKTIIREMNRLGMMVDLSHVSKGTMRDALEVSEAPVIFSHSSAYELCNSSRNVRDDMLQSLAKNGGLVMVNFYSTFLSCSENSTVHDAVAHINHIKRVAGIDHVGLGAGFDGINFTPKGLEDVSTYPTLFAELLGAGWSIEDLTKLAGGNFIRVMQQVEKIRDLKKSSGAKPFEDHPNFRTDDPYNCTSS